MSRYSYFTNVWLSCSTFYCIYIHCESKKTRCQQLRETLTDFQNYFTAGYPKKVTSKFKTTYFRTVLLNLDDFCNIRFHKIVQQHLLIDVGGIYNDCFVVNFVLNFENLLIFC